MARIASFLASLLLAVGLFATAPARAEALVVYAAASTTEVMTEIGRRFEAEHGQAVRLSFAASSVLARQIERGAPADIFLSADVAWMDRLQSKGAVVARSRRNLLRNSLVLIGHASGAPDVALSAETPLARILGDGFLAMGDPAHVPAGRYGRQALRHFGHWSSLKGRLAYAASVREALALVARGEAPLGIAYATDVAISDQVRVVAAFSEASHAPIVYPVALVAGGRHPSALSLLDFLDSDTANEVYRRFGFRRWKPAGDE
ncbi:MAG: molybdate ABC transporter substrate-binding protein [Alphaproteobacteria bacterium]|jgi:molybdate transport system substrate-binding protein|nr:molybdate ABC transporter substrate-binding protein [Alphaproteobacteria bacterium]